MSATADPILGLSRQAANALLAIAHEKKHDIETILLRADALTRGRRAPMILERDIEVARQQAERVYL